MKKIFSFLLLCLVLTTAKAQFTQGTKYINASLSNFGLSYSAKEAFRLGISAEAGYFLADNVMARVYVGYQHTKFTDDVMTGLGLRYYFIENGIYMGAGAELNHLTPNNNDLMLPFEVGYTFYLNHYLAIEPSVYYKMSLSDFPRNSAVGLKLGFGYYF